MNVYYYSEKQDKTIFLGEDTTGLENAYYKMIEECMENPEIEEDEAESTIELWFYYLEYGEPVLPTNETLYIEK